MKTLNIYKRQFKEINKQMDGNVILAGPCAVESYEQMSKVAQCISRHSLKYIRGGAYKPRTSPYSFQGLGKEGLHILKAVCDEYNLIGVTEILDIRDLDDIQSCVDILQVGARNMYNYPLLRELGKLKKTVLLKRGFMSTYKELMLAAEYILNNGNDNIIICERGIRTFETSTRNTLDLSIVALIKEDTEIPVIVDLSHSLGRKDIIVPMAKASVAAGANGLMVEVHPNPDKALSDQKQQLSINEFENVLKNLKL